MNCIKCGRNFSMDVLDHLQRCPGCSYCDNNAEVEADQLRAQLAALRAENAELRAALTPFAEFAEKFEQKPISGLDDELYSIHAGQHRAVFRLSDCRRAIAVLAKHAETPTARDRDPVAHLRGLKDGWDSYGAVAPTPAALDRAAAILRELAGKPSVVTAYNSGEIALEWQTVEIIVGERTLAIESFEAGS